MSQPQPRARLWRMLLPLILFILGCPAPAPDSGPAPTGIMLYGQVAEFTPGGQANFLVQVLDPYTQQPQAKAALEVLLGPADGEATTVFRGVTDQQGLAQVNFAVPTVDTPQQRLTVRAVASNSTLEAGADTYIGPVYQMLVSSDKPVYQPGQTIHMRTLALAASALKPAQSEPLTLTVQDPAGNKLMRQELTTSEFGIAAADFVLDSKAASGDYQISAELGPVVSTRRVEVKPYTLPRFKVTFASDKPYYLPGETATGVVEARYFFGKPVAAGQVTIRGFVIDQQRSQVLEMTGVTDEAGRFDAEIAIPDSFRGQLTNRSATVDLEIEVVDAAQHAERTDESVTVAEQPILIDVAPESVSLRAGLENILYLHTSYPDGQDAQTELTVTSNEGISATVQTDGYGLAAVPISVPTQSSLQLIVSATDGRGQASEQPLWLYGDPTETTVLLRPATSEVHIGETLALSAFVAGPAQTPISTVYVEVVKGGQTYDLLTAPVEDGVAHTSLEIDGQLLGTLELNALIVDANGVVSRDRRLVLVNPAPAEVTVVADADEYRPGQTARLDIAVSQAGAALPGVVGVSIVDESVFAVGQEEAGFARTYFLLQRELQEPRYAIHGFRTLEDDDPSPYDHAADGRSARAGRELALAGFFAQQLAAAAPVAPQRAETGSTIPTGALGWLSRLPLVLPLVGMALYNGTPRRRRLLVGLILIGLASFFFGACGSPSAAPASETAASASPAEGTAGQSAPLRVRQFFPETLYWLAEKATDAAGHVQIEVPLADSITSWQVSVLASDQAGNLGSAAIGLRVFQPFFVEPDLPRFLTVGDELSVPVRLYNYLDKAQTVKLSVQPDDWFELTQEPAASVDLAPNEVSVLYVPIRVTAFGPHELRVTADGDQANDAVVRQVEVLPDGQAVTAAQGGLLATDQTLALQLPADAVPGTGHVTVKLYPGVTSQIVDGLAGLLRTPYGCFEQTTSVTYPNVLVLDYLQHTGQTNPQLQFQAVQLINLGYQRLVSFEVANDPGGFSLYGDWPAETMLTAYGLMQFTDMSRVSYVDPALIERITNFLLSRQQPDGHWSWYAEEAGLGQNTAQLDLMATAYVSWALADAGLADSEAVARGLAYMDASLAAGLRPRTLGSAGQNATPTPSEASTTSDQLDVYTLALAANAFVAAGHEADGLLDRLVESAKVVDHNRVYWPGRGTWLGASGGTADLETTALATIALLRSKQHPSLAEDALTYISAQRDGFGSFYTTQATVLALKALLLAAEADEEAGDATVTVLLDGQAAQTVEITPENADLMQPIGFDQVDAGQHTVRITVDGERTLHYQVVTDYYAPWLARQTQDEAVHLDVHYDRTTLAVNDTVSAKAGLVLQAPGDVATLLVTLGVPPGFSPLSEDLDALVDSGQIDRYEQTGRQIVLYLSDVASDQEYTFPYRLVARFPIKALTPGSRAYDYYTPDRQGSAPPQLITVGLAAP